MQPFFGKKNQKPTEQAAVSQLRLVMEVEDEHVIENRFELRHKSHVIGVIDIGFEVGGIRKRQHPHMSEALSEAFLTDISTPLEGLHLRDLGLESCERGLDFADLFNGSSGFELEGDDVPQRAVSGEGGGGCHKKNGENGEESHGGNHSKPAANLEARKARKDGWAHLPGIFDGGSFSFYFPGSTDLSASSAPFAEFLRVSTAGAVAGGTTGVTD